MPRGDETRGCGAGRATPRAPGRRREPPLELYDGCALHLVDGTHRLLVIPQLAAQAVRRARAAAPPAVIEEVSLELHLPPTSTRPQRAQ
eukprot:3058949-Prymnesium_polylepis.2